MMQGFKGTVQFPTLPANYQERSVRYLESRTMASAVRKLLNEVYREDGIRCRRPTKVVVKIEFVRTMEP